jgi:hypothetical protein
MIFVGVVDSGFYAMRIREYFVLCLDQSNNYLRSSWEGTAGALPGG